MSTEIDGVNGIIKNTTSDGDITIKGNDGGSEISALTLDMSDAGAATFNGALTVAGAAILNGGIDVAGDFNFDVGGGDITFKDDGTSVVNFGLESGNFIVNATASDTDIIFKGNDGGSAITALTFDMSAAGAATFNDKITAVGTSVFTNLDISGDIDVDGTTNLDVVDIDGAVDMASTLQVDGAITSSAGATITTADNTDTLTLTSTDADGNPGPVLNYYRNSSSPADNDYIGRNIFTFNNSSPAVETALAQNVIMTDVSDTTEDVKYVHEQMTAGSIIERFTISASEAVFNEGSVDVDFRVESNGDANMLFVDGSQNLVRVGNNAHTNSLISANFDLVIGNESSGATGLAILATNNENSYVGFFDQDNSSSFRGAFNYNHTNDYLRIYAGGDERMRISSNILIGTTDNSPAESSSATGMRLGTNGGTQIATSGMEVMRMNRNSDDGAILVFSQAGSAEGNISVSGTTISYAGFTGTHWSRLADNSKPEILRGTIMDSIDEMCDWYQAVVDVPEVLWTADDNLMEGANVGDVKEKAYQFKESISLGDKSVGDSITFTKNETEYTGTIVKEGDVKHTKCKVSDTADSKKVYGIFSNWDDADDGLDGDVNDMYVAQVGTFIIRVHKDVTVAAGDLLVSNGDGTAKLQDDDIIRSKTVAKVNSNIKVETYSDGSYTVPCTLHC